MLWIAAIVMVAVSAVYLIHNFKQTHPLFLGKMSVGGSIFLGSVFFGIATITMYQKMMGSDMSWIGAMAPLLGMYLTFPLGAIITNVILTHIHGYRWRQSGSVIPG